MLSTETPLPGLKRAGLKWPGSNARISESCAAPVFTRGTRARNVLRLPTTRVTATLRPRSGTGSPSLAGAGLARATGPDPIFPGAASNEAGILLMHKALQKYVGVVVVIDSGGASDSWFLASDFCSCVKRSQNLLDGQGVENLTRDLDSLRMRCSATANSRWDAGLVYVNRRRVYVNGRASIPASRREW